MVTQWTPLLNSQSEIEAQYKPNFQELANQASEENVLDDDGSRKYNLNVTYPVTPSSDGPRSDQSATSSPSGPVGDVRSPLFSPVLTVKNLSDVGLDIKGSNGDGDSGLRSAGKAVQTETVCITLCTLIPFFVRQQHLPIIRSICQHCCKIQYRVIS